MPRNSPYWQVLCFLWPNKCTNSQTSTETGFRATSAKLFTLPFWRLTNLPRSVRFWTKDNKSRPGKLTKIPVTFYSSTIILLCFCFQRPSVWGWALHCNLNVVATRSTHYRHLDIEKMCHENGLLRRIWFIEFHWICHGCWNEHERCVDFARVVSGHAGRMLLGWIYSSGFLFVRGELRCVKHFILGQSAWTVGITPVKSDCSCWHHFMLSCELTGRPQTGRF